jgi:diguanylate cyclase (GGDEF)-like protein
MRHHRAKRRDTRKIQLLEATNQVLKKAVVDPDERSLAHAFLNAARKLTASAVGWVLERTNQQAPGQWRLLAANCLAVGDAPEGRHPNGLPIPMTRAAEELWKRLAANDGPLACGPGRLLGLDPLFADYPAVRFLLVVPLKVDGSVGGLIALGNRRRGYGHQDRRAVESLADVFGQALQRKRIEKETCDGENKLRLALNAALSEIAKYQSMEKSLQKANAALQRLAAQDGLTRIANRRRFDEQVILEWRRALREFRSVAIIMCDIDHFKSYNDYFGHVKGDDALRDVAQAIAETLKRPMDLAARYGGEEFAVLLPTTDIQGATRLAAELQRAIAALGIEHPANPVGETISLSFGVAAGIPGGAMQPKDLIEAADRALYQAKQLGRNRIVPLSLYSDMVEAL